MALTPFPVERFGALNLADDPVEVGADAAVDCLNVDFDRYGRVRNRSGYAGIVSPTVTSADGFATFRTTSGTKQFVVGYQNGGTKTYAAYASTGGAAVSTAAPTSTLISAVRFGTPSNQYLYLANSADTVWRWSGAAFTQPAGMPTAAYLALLPASNRLVAGYGNTVEFSDQGAPETWSGNTVDLTPGDESVLCGLANWQDMVFAFKRNRFFVFDGEGISADGDPEFTPRSIDGYGCLESVRPVAGDEGVYFFDGRSIWVTSGGVPVRVSRNIEPFIRGNGALDIVFTGYVISQTLLQGAKLSYAGGRLYVSLYTTSAGVVVTLVFDPKIDAWTLYSTNLRFAADLVSAATDEESVFWLGNDGKVNRFGSSSLTDAGVAFNWQYTSGYYDMGHPGQTKITQESRLFGTQNVGTDGVTLLMVSDGTADFGSSLSLASLPTGVWQQIDREAVIFQHRLKGNTGTSVVVNRLVHYVSFVKPAGVE